MLPKWISQNTAHAIYPVIYLPQSVYSQWVSDVVSQQIYAVIEHERVHLQRQKKIGLFKWLLLYLLSPEFRVREELLAIKAQLAYLKSKGVGYDLQKIAWDLSGATYLWAISYNQAREKLQAFEINV